MEERHRADRARISLSLHCASQLDMMSQLRELEQLDFDWYHIDITDGVFAPNFALGTLMVQELRRFTERPIYAHLMTVAPEEKVRSMAEAGVNGVSFHIETCRFPFRLAREIRSLGMSPGVVLTPITPVSALGELIHEIDLITIMSVEPGYSGQQFLPFSYGKIRALKQLLTAAKCDVMIEIDGGVDNEIAAQCRQHGADCIVAGFFTVFRSDAGLTENYNALVKALA